MKNAIVCFYDVRFLWLKEYMCYISHLNIVGFVSLPYNALNMNDNALEDICYEFDKYDTVVLLENDNVDIKYAYDEVVRYIERRKNIISFYTFDEASRKSLIEKSREFEVEILFLTALSHNYLNLTENRPVIVISGLNEYTNQFETHLAMNSVLKELGYKPLNITNDRYGLLFDFFDINSVIQNEKIKNFEGLISKLKFEINKQMKTDKYDIIVFSDIYGVMPHNEYLRNQYGIYNFIMKNVISYDYLLLNIYAKKYYQEDIDRLKQVVTNETGVTNISIGLSHYFENMLEVQDDCYKTGYLLSNGDYNNIIYELRKNLSNEIIDTTNTEDLKKYILSLYE